jgi:hypothetical protein
MHVRVEDGDMGNERTEDALHWHRTNIAAGLRI